MLFFSLFPPPSPSLPAMQAYRFDPVCLDIVAWLGYYFVKCQLYEKAIPYFARAAAIEPQDVRAFRLLIYLPPPPNLLPRARTQAHAGPNPQACAVIVSFLVVGTTALGGRHDEIAKSESNRSRQSFSHWLLSLLARRAAQVAAATGKLSPQARRL